MPILLALAGASASIAAPQRGAETAEKRPRIGLVLSGGGARGAAHIGVLKVLEEFRVPVDLLACTSMGAVVGGLYASGYSPERLEATFRDADWADLFSDDPPRDDVSFRRKEDDRDVLFRFEIGIGRHGVSFPSGIVAAQKINFLLRRLTLHTADLGSFDDLPIPFRAVATNLNDGKPVVLDHGDLAEAIRASMALPGILTPVEVDGRILVDGGLVANLPVDVAEAMGADRIIAVDVGTPPEKLQQAPSALAVSTQTFIILSERYVEEQRARLGPDDLLITPELDEIPWARFDRVLEAIRRGEEAARRLGSELSTFSVSEEEYEAFRRRQRIGLRLAAMTVDSIEVHGLDRVDPRMVTSRLKTRPGTVLDLETLQEDLTRVYRIGEFEHVDFRVVRDGESHALIIDATEKSWGPGYLRFGMGLEADFSGRGEYVLIGNYRRAQVNRLGAEWRNILRIGSVFSLSSEFFQPFNFSGSWFVAPLGNFVRVQEEEFLPSGKRELVRNDVWSLELDLGVQFQNVAEIRVGVLTGNLDVVARTGEPFRALASLGGWIAKFTFDRQDNAWFPRRGTFSELRLLLSRESLGAAISYDRLSADLSHAWSFGANTLTGAARLGSSLGSNLPFYAEFELGGFLSLSGLERGALQGDAMGLLSLIYYRRIGNLGPLGDGLYVGGAVQAGNVWEDSSQAEFGSLLYSATLFFGTETVVGPIYVGWGYTEGGHASAHLFLGRLF